MKDRRLDSEEFIPPTLPFDSRPAKPDATPRLYPTSINTFITNAGTIKKRPQLQLAGFNAISGGKIKKLWWYETIPNSSGVTYYYVLACVYFPATGYYNLYGKEVTSGFSGSLAQVGTLRDMHQSSRAHVLADFKGKLYVKGFPVSSEKLGTVIVDGSTGSLVVTPWGLLPPATPAKISGKVTKLSVAMDASSVGVITVDSTTGFSTSYPLQIGAESIAYTSNASGTTFGGTVTRGQNGTTAEKHGDNTIVLQRDWAASDHQVDVTQGWYYSYAYVNKCTDSSTPTKGQISSRAPLQTNPDLLPSFTGPFRDLVPKIIIQGNADTTNIPYINIYRTKNGGGTFLFLEQITNTGAGDITYYDDSFGTGGSSTTYNDPVPDDVLDGENRRLGPSTVSNDPPPTVEDPLITGTNTPSNLCFGMAIHAGRIWISVGKTLFYSSREELIAGINEESFKSGTAGNFIPFGELIVGLESTNQGLYVLTTKRLVLITGITRDTFTDVQISMLGGAIPSYDKHERNLIGIKETVAYVTFDGNVVLMEDGKPRVISDPIIGFYDGLSTGDFLPRDLAYYRDSQYEILILAHNYTELDAVAPGPHTAVPYWYIYDMKKSKTLNTDFWWSPWKAYTCAMLSAQSSSTTYRYMLGAICREVSTYTTALVLLSSLRGAYYTCLDANISSGSYTTRSYDMITGIANVRPPVGNNLNRENRPLRDCELEGLQLHLNNNNSSPAFSIEPSLVATADNMTTGVSAVQITEPPRIQNDNATATEEVIKYYAINHNCYRSSIDIEVTSQLNFELLGLKTWWDISGGIE